MRLCSDSVRVSLRRGTAEAEGVGSTSVVGSSGATVGAASRKGDGRGSAARKGEGSGSAASGFGSSLVVGVVAVFAGESAAPKISSTE